jgi:hypothetical protein
MTNDALVPVAEQQLDPRGHLPDTLLVQLCDHMQHDQGVKRHAITVTVGSDGLAVTNLVRDVRRDLKGMLATTYWQMHQTHERTAFFVCTRVSHGTADMLVTSMTQRVISHIEEKFGYRLQTSNVTLSPDVQHTKVRMLYQYFVFRKLPLAECNQQKMLMSTLIEAAEERAAAAAAAEGKSNRRLDGDDEAGNDDAAAEDDEGAADGFDAKHRAGLPEFRNFEAPQVGPQDPSKPEKTVPKSQAVERIWKD